MANDRRPSPDGDSRQTGASDPYLGNLAHKSETAADEGRTVAPDNWSSSDYRSDTISCYDPYLVEVARAIRSDF